MSGTRLSSFLLRQLCQQGEEMMAHSASLNQHQQLGRSAQVPQNFLLVNRNFGPFHPMSTSVLTSPLYRPSNWHSTPRSSLFKPNPLPRCRHAHSATNEKRPRLTVVRELMSCSNCGTQITSAWRRDSEGNIECNACHSYFWKNGRKRPPTMRTDKVVQRYRVSRCRLCAVEAQRIRNSSAQHQDAVDRHQQNDLRSSSNILITRRCTFSNQLAPAAAHNFFERSGIFAQPVPMILSPNNPHGLQCPLMMTYRAKVDVLNVASAQQQPLVHGRPSISTHPRGAFNTLTSEVFNQQTPTMAANSGDQEALSNILPSCSSTASRASPEVASNAAASGNISAGTSQ